MTDQSTTQPDLVPRWDDAHRYSPAVLHRRRLIRKLLRGLAIGDVLDAGCAQPYLLADLAEQFGIPGAGCDLSAQVISTNRQRYPQWEFQALDLAAQRWPDGRQFDLVACSEVLEHIPAWQAAVGNLAAMSRRYLLITVPSGRIHHIDRHIGHLQHFAGPELAREVERHGFRILRQRRWGFPFHSLYKYAINGIAPDAIYQSFGEQAYGPGKRLVSMLISGLFYLNDCFPGGSQLLLLAERMPTTGKGAS